MTECTELSDRMVAVERGEVAWTPIELAHLASCSECAAEWRLVQLGSTLHGALMVDSDRIAARLLAQLRDASMVLPLRRLPWRHFAIGLAAAASIALAVWAPTRNSSVLVVALPNRIGLNLPVLSAMTDEQFDRVSMVTEGNSAGGVPGAVPHIGDLTESDLEQLSHLTESP